MHDEASREKSGKLKKEPLQALKAVKEAGVDGSTGNKERAYSSSSTGFVE